VNFNSVKASLFQKPGTKIVNGHFCVSIRLRVKFSFIRPSRYNASSEIMGKMVVVKRVVAIECVSYGISKEP